MIFNTKKLKCYMIIVKKINVKYNFEYSKDYFLIFICSNETFYEIEIFIKYDKEKLKKF